MLDAAGLSRTYSRNGATTKPPADISTPDSPTKKISRSIARSAAGLAPSAAWGAAAGWVGELKGLGLFNYI